MAILGIDKCCFCVEHLLGVKILAIFFTVAYGIDFVYSLTRGTLESTITDGILLASVIFLLLGAFRNDRRFFLPWIVIFGAIIVIQLVIAIYYIFGRGRHWADHSQHIILFPLMIYFWLVVVALYQRMGTAGDISAV